AFFDADVIDVELLYDNAMLKVNYSQARRWRTRTILSGSNQSTEGMLMPEGWNWQKIDRKNIRSIGLSQNVKLSSFPSIGVPDYLFYRSVSRIKWVPFLDFLNYNKEDSLNYLERNFEFKRYPYKHYESVFTRFYQGYLLPEKFGIDKRRLHLSNLVITKQLTREEALSRLQENPYPSIRDLQMDIRYFLKKMEWDEDDLSNYLSRAERPHDEWGSEVGRWRFIVGVNKKLRWMRPSLFPGTKRPIPP
ncbi:MAG: hypothetical protein VKK05_09520, partial [Synechococcus sp.]|nr:hypothetical protein [Synechococcus sp.]